MALRLEPAPDNFGQAENDCWLWARGREFVKYFSIADDRQETTSEDLLNAAMQAGYDSLWEEHKAFWHSYFSRSTISIPSARFQCFYEASLYHFKGMQNPMSSGTRTSSSVLCSKPIMCLRRWKPSVSFNGRKLPLADMPATSSAVMD
jgi:hypothetical protein